MENFEPINLPTIEQISFKMEQDAAFIANMNRLFPDAAFQGLNEKCYCDKCCWDRWNGKA